MSDSAICQDLINTSSDFDRLKADYSRIQDEVRRLKKATEENSQQLESALEHSNRMVMEAQVTFLELKQVFNASSDSMWVVDKNYKIRMINKALLSMFGKREADVIDKNCYELLSVSACQSDICPLKNILIGKKYVEFDINYVKEDQTAVPCILSASPFLNLDGDVIGMVTSFKDITERKQAEEDLMKLNLKLKQQANIDSLTQVPNRREFNRYLKREWFRLSRNRHPLSLIMCDVDFFKPFNDTYGHTAGDECLYSVAQAIRSSLKRAADFVARYGGEEFVVILPETDAQGAFHVAESIRTQVHQLGVEHKGSLVESVVTISLGVSTLIPEVSQDPGKIVESADKALYQAKEKGRNQTAMQTIELITCS